MSSFVPESLRCFRESVGVAFLLYWNIAGLCIHFPYSTQTLEISSRPLTIAGFFLSMGLFFFCVAGSSAARSMVMHPDRVQHYKARDLIGFGGLFTLPALLVLLAAYVTHP